MDKLTSCKPIQAKAASRLPTGTLPSTMIQQRWLIDIDIDSTIDNSKFESSVFIGSWVSRNGLVGYYVQLYYTGID